MKLNPFVFNVSLFPDRLLGSDSCFISGTQWFVIVSWVSGNSCPGNKRHKEAGIFRDSENMQIVDLLLAANLERPCVL